jgi:hypothetical protein
MYIIVILDIQGHDYKNTKHSPFPLTFPSLAPSPFGEGWGEAGARGQIEQITNK